MKQFKVLVVLCISSFIGACSSSESKQTFNIIWKNYNGEILENDIEVPRGSLPSYDGEIPTRPSDDAYNYVFTGWDPKVYYVGSDRTYTATYSAELISYEIEYFLNGGANSKSNPSSYNAESSITFDSATKDCFTFLGWFDENDNEVTSIAKGTTGNLKLYAKWNDGNMCTVTLDANGGSLSEDYIQVKYNTTYSLPTPKRDGYTFDGWYYNNKKIGDNGVYSYSSTAIFVAHWNPIEYEIEYFLDGGTNASSNPSSYNSDCEIILSSPYKNHYTFIGWFDENDNEVTSIAKGTTGNLKLYAKWNDGNFYTIYLNANGGRASVGSMMVRYNHTYTLPIPTRNGYTFNGWDGPIGEDVDGVKTYTCKGNAYFTASWTIEKYQITYELNGGANSDLNPNVYTVEDKVTFSDPVREGYEFLGWFSNDEKVTELVKQFGNLTLEGKWSCILHDLIVASDDIGKGTVQINEGTGYTDELITIKASPVSPYVFKGWYLGNELLSEYELYSFVMPNADCSIKGVFYSKEEHAVELEKRLGKKPYLYEEKNKVSYGLYPQSIVTEDWLIAELDLLNTTSINGWYFYKDNYYAKKTIDYLSYKYSTNYLENGKEIIIGGTYWFKCETILWDILSINDDEILLLSSFILDYCYFYEQRDNRVINGEIVYPSNYEYSNIRDFLNNDFYNAAFVFDNSYLKKTFIDNSYSTVLDFDHSNKYFCNNTEDFVFLLSYVDYKNSSYGFSNNNKTARCCKNSDWAIASGSYYYQGTELDYHYFGTYLTRSSVNDPPYCDGANTICGINYNGEITRYASSGVRPAIKIAKDF